MNTKQYLKQAYRLNELIKSNQEELSELKESVLSIPGIDYSTEKIQNSKSSGDAGYVNIISKIYDLEKSINSDIEKMFDLKNEIRSVINDVIDNDEKLVLRLRYINFNTWEEISNKLNVSVRTIHRTHSSALLNVNIPQTDIA